MPTKIMCPVDSRLLELLKLNAVDVEQYIIDSENKMNGEWGCSQEFGKKLGEIEKALKEEASDQ